MPLRIRARDVQALVQEHGFERAMVMITTYALEEQSEQRQQMRELTELAARCIDEVEKLIHIGGEMRNRLDELKRQRQQGDRYGEEG